MATTVTALHRFAVKGLERDSLASVALTSGGAFPSDRRWALMYENTDETFSPSSPEWLHKSHFLCAFTANELLASFSSRFDDATQTLEVRQRSDDSVLLCESLDEPSGRAAIEAFFSDAAGRPVHVVSSATATDNQHHQFGNTASGVNSGDGSTRTIHIVNANTVNDLNAKSGYTFHPERFRGNLLIGGDLKAWEEFDWVDHTIRIGDEVTLRVIKKTVRCEGVNVDAKHGSGKADVDVPSLLTTHFPEHGPYLGVYAQVVNGGSIQIGDRVEAVEALTRLRGGALTPLPMSFRASDWKDSFRGASKATTILAEDQNGKRMGSVGLELLPLTSVGMGTGDDVCPRPLLSGLVVEPRFRRRGVARQLVAEAEAFVSSEWGNDEILLFVEESNRAAVGLYDACGYVKAADGTRVEQPQQQDDDDDDAGWGFLRSTMGLGSFSIGGEPLCLRKRLSR